MSDLVCEYCNAPGKLWKGFDYQSFDCGCEDYQCGTQRLCETGDLAMPAGLYQSAACKQLQEKGGWNGN